MSAIRRLALGASAFLLASLAAAQAPGAAPPPASDHPDPGLSPSFALFPDHASVVEALRSYQGHPWMRLHELGASGAGRPIWMVEATDPNSSVPLPDRVVTFVFTQQHGNEPAGTPAALDVLAEVAAGGPLASTLSNQVLLLLPMANPDGAEAEQRANAGGVDINRDHIALGTPEARVLHKALNGWDVHVAMDHHEYGGTGAGNPVPVRVYDYDLTTMFPNHGNVQVSTGEAARDLMYEGLWPAAEAKGFTANEYGEQTVAGVPVQQVAGGPDPGIMRNHLGLHHVAGILVETRVDAHPNPFHDAARRTDIHRTVMDATLRYVHENAQRFIDAKRAAVDDAVATPDANYVEGEVQQPLAPAYRVPAAEKLDGTFDLHALPAGVPSDAGLVYNLDHAYRGHAAAALHPASSRRLVDGAVAAEPVHPVVAPPAVEKAAGSETPAPALAGVVAVAAGVGLGLSRRRS